MRNGCPACFLRTPGRASRRGTPARNLDGAWNSVASPCATVTSCTRLTGVAWFVVRRRKEGLKKSPGGWAPTRPPRKPVMPAPLATASQTAHQPFQHAAAAVLHTAERLFAMDPEWVVFFREVLGVDGIVSRTFGAGDARMRFECTPQYARIREMLDALRSREQDRPADRESNRVVTVRMPRSLHEALKAEAAGRRMSINTLCITKLLRTLEADGECLRGDAAEPPPPPKRPGRRPR